MNESVARVLDRVLRGLGLKALNAQFLLFYVLMFGLTARASVALYLNISVSPEIISVAGAQHTFNQRIAHGVLQLRFGIDDSKTLAVTIIQYKCSVTDLDTSNAGRNVSRMGVPEIAAQW